MKPLLSDDSRRNPENGGNANTPLKARPLKVIFENHETNMSVLSRAPRIKQTKDLSLEAECVFIRPDQTELERENDIKLRKELRQKRKDDPNWMMRGMHQPPQHVPEH